MSARGAFAVVLACAVAGCSLGVGSAFVGQWRPHDQVEYEACLVDDAGGCADHKRVVSHVPGRRFWGVIITYPGVGGASVVHDGMTTTRLRLDPSLEVLRGSGRFALGVRTGVMLDVKQALALNAMAIGRISMTERLSLHAGVGYVPFAATGTEQSLVGARGMVGAQLALSRTHSENYIVVTLEADSTWIDFARSYRSTGITGHIGIFF